MANVKNDNARAQAETSLPMISAVMPTYNQGAYIRLALESIFSQNYPKLEVIVVDGMSTDNTIEILKSYGDRIRWISEKDKNQSDALNKGFAMARGEIIAWLNSDDLYDEGAFLTVGRYFAEHPDVMWLYGRAIIIDEEGEEIRRWVTNYKNFFLPRYRYSGLLIQNTLSQMAVFFRRRVVEEVGLLDVGLHNAMDYDYWLRLGKRYKPAYLDQNFGKFRLHTGSKTIKQSRDLFDSDYACAKKYGAGRPHLIFLHKIFHFLVMILYPCLSRMESSRKKRR